MKDYENDYEEFWKPIIEKDGIPNLDQIKRELFDFHKLIKSATKVFCVVTGEKISKPNTKPEEVIAEYNHELERMISEAIAEDREARES